MSRIRATLLAALAGILITAGGCADSATAPTAAAGPSLDRAQRDTTPGANPGQGQQKDRDGGEITIQSGYISGGH